jgi:CRP-like cAMP-binding protein
MVAVMLSAIQLRNQTGNLFIDALPKGSADAVTALLESVPVSARQRLVGPAEKLAFAWFPIDGVISIVATDRVGVTVQVGLIGKEGLYGASVLMGDDRVTNDVVIQIPGAFMRIGSAAFLDLAKNDPDLRVAALRYVQSMLVTSAQLTLCNRLHSVEARCARWALMAHDRVHGDTIQITHEYLATMLGVSRRATVTETISRMEEAGFIAQRHRQVRITDRLGMEAVACECYLAVNLQLERLMSYAIRKGVSTPVVLSAN